jgi:hypothetical protein
MTGASGGFCVLKVPDGPREPMAGIAGRQGSPVTITSFSERGKTLLNLRLQAMHLENMLNGVRHRIRELEAGRDLPAAGSRD